MSFTGEDFDEKNYKEIANSSVRSGLYMVERPFVSNTNCYVQSPSIRLQKSGVNISKQDMIDSESILKNIIKSDKTRQYDTVLDKALEQNSDCKFTDQVYSRIHDDPTSRRGKHIDRFDYTHFNSQAHAIERFAFNENSDLQMRDAHKPIIPEV
jgi:hypothetical protein